MGKVSIKKAVAMFFLQAMPTLIMVILVFFIKNDYTLTAFILIITVIAFLIKYERYEIWVYSVGFITMLVFEILFVSTGVETFNRNSLFGIIPIWLPFLWAYGIVAVRRCARLIDLL
jgi:hypothetical protein